MINPANPPNETAGSESELALLEKRARELARAPLDPTETGAFLDIVQFTMARACYGVASQFVKEVQPLRDFTPLPGLPPFVLGILAVRGRVVSLVDLKVFFAIPERGLSDINHVVVLSGPDMEFGILADELLGVRRLPEAELQGDIATFSGRRKEYLHGVAPDGTVVLDAGKILADPELVVRDKVND